MALGAGELGTLENIIGAIFCFAHSMTGLVALLFQKDLSSGFLLATDKFELPNPNLEQKKWKVFMRCDARTLAPAPARKADARPLPARVPRCRGPKRDGLGTAPNVRAWGARQLTVGMVLLTALLLQEKGAFTTAKVAVFTRVTGDVIQNVLDGCYWKLGVFSKGLPGSGLGGRRTHR